VEWLKWWGACLASVWIQTPELPKNQNNN
jgi:hypothetical protein